MHRYRGVFVLPLLAGWLACGGATFSPDDDPDGGSGSGGHGGSAATGPGTSSTTGPGTTSTTTNEVTSGPATGPGTSAVTSTSTTSTTTASGGAGGGASGTGGSGGLGGRAGSGGQAVDSGRDADASRNADANRDASPDACDAATPTPVTFRLTEAPGASYCINFCGPNNWVTVLPPDGGQAFTLTVSCTTMCDVCQPLPCVGFGASDGPDFSPPPSDDIAVAIGCAPPQPLPAMGVTFTWSGFLWTPGQCGPNNYACVSSTCGTPAGKYIARMCANRRTSDAGPFCNYDPVQTCVDVPFEYPTTTVVEGVLR